MITRRSAVASILSSWVALKTEGTAKPTPLQPANCFTIPVRGFTSDFTLTLWSPDAWEAIPVQDRPETVAVEHFNPEAAGQSVQVTPDGWRGRWTFVARRWDQLYNMGACTKEEMVAEAFTL